MALQSSNTWKDQDEDFPECKQAREVMPWFPGPIGIMFDHMPENWMCVLHCFGLWHRRHGSIKHTRTFITRKTGYVCCIFGSESLKASCICIDHRVLLQDCTHTHAHTQAVSYHTRKHPHTHTHTHTHTHKLYLSSAFLRMLFDASCLCASATSSALTGLIMCYSEEEYKDLYRQRQMIRQRRAAELAAQQMARTVEAAAGSAVAAAGSAAAAAGGAVAAAQCVQANAEGVGATAAGLQAVTAAGVQPVTAADVQAVTAGAEATATGVQADTAGAEAAPAKSGETGTVATADGSSNSARRRRKQQRPAKLNLYQLNSEDEDSPERQEKKKKQRARK
jgi:hypothetical protein